MYMRQTQVLDSFVRVRSCLEAYPATGTLTYARARRPDVRAANATLWSTPKASPWRSG